MILHRKKRLGLPSPCYQRPKERKKGRGREEKGKEGKGEGGEGEGREGGGREHEEGG